MKPINWYPGHMKKTRELIDANLKLVDAVVEVCDARIPVSSRNPILSDLTAGKARVLALNKSDLADEDATREWLDCFRRSGTGNLPGAYTAALALNSMSGDGLRGLLSRLEHIEEEKTAAGAASFKGERSLRLMIVGIPNSGKSSLINRLTGRRATQVGDRPGVTRGKQWLTLANGMQLLDTPGILWPKFEDPEVGLNLAFCGAIRDEIMDIVELGLELISVLMREHSAALAARYGSVIAGADPQSMHGDEFDEDGHPIGPADPALAAMDQIARARGFLLQGGRIDYERTARMILDEFRAGKIGRITLERAP
ncbi:MAG: ribosome biogenesis GTPase YlqF [Clostridiales Family XIII bacterium]|jgi:ribosome biogenesis GTPase A|nr:ribosome biogenesis GTPase YlqF [Clostridiales Family XIII bacterium]